jgi:hypothetical protein
MTTANLHNSFVNQLMSAKKKAAMTGMGNKNVETDIAQGAALAANDILSARRLRDLQEQGQDQSYDLGLQGLAFNQQELDAANERFRQQLMQSKEMGMAELGLQEAMAAAEQDYRNQQLALQQQQFNDQLSFQQSQDAYMRQSAQDAQDAAWRNQLISTPVQGGMLGYMLTDSLSGGLYGAAAGLALPFISRLFG